MRLSWWHFTVFVILQVGLSVIFSNSLVGSATSSPSLRNIIEAESQCRKNTTQCPELKKACSLIRDYKGQITYIEWAGERITQYSQEAQNTGHDAGAQLAKGKIVAEKAKVAGHIAKMKQLEKQFETEYETGLQECTTRLESENQPPPVGVEKEPISEKVKASGEEASGSFGDVATGALVILGAVATGAALGLGVSALIKKQEKCDSGDKASCTTKVFCEKGKDEEGNPKFEPKLVKTKVALNPPKGCFVDKPTPSTKSKDKQDDDAKPITTPNNELSESSAPSLAEQAQNEEDELIEARTKEFPEEDVSTSENVGGNIAQDPADAGGIVTSESVSDDANTEDVSLSHLPDSDARGKDSNESLSFNKTQKGSTVPTTRQPASLKQSSRVNRIDSIESEVLKSDEPQNMIFNRVSNQYKELQEDQLK